MCYDHAVNPVITLFAPDDGRYVARADDSVSFQCNATGVPPPTIQWFREGQILNTFTDSRYSLSNHTSTAPDRDLGTVWRTLVISNVTTNESDVNYSCNASNEASLGMASETFELFVQGKMQS